METLFQIWHELKVKLQRRNLPKSFHERDIFWTHCGKNIGCEINGKSREFLRPILVFKKLSRETFVGIPLTTKSKNGNYFFEFGFLDKKSIAIFAQIRVFDSKRLAQKLGKISKKNFSNLKKELKKFLF